LTWMWEMYRLSTSRPLTCRAQNKQCHLHL
jgi:hypothetical protein